MSESEPVRRRFRTLAEMAADVRVGEVAKIGIYCPRCGCQVFKDAAPVDKTKHVVGGIARYRVCRGCKYRWRTLEH